MKMKNYKWFALALLWVAFFLQQGTRQLFGPSAPAIREALGVDRVTVGMVNTVFALVYGICVPFAGLAADLFNRKWMVTVGVAVFCVGIFLSGFVASVGLLVVAYGVLNGFGQTFFYPSATSLISQLHAESRATAMSILQLGLYFGIVGCGGLAGWVAAQGPESWRWPFWAMGGVGIAWAAALAFLLRDTKPVVTGTADRPSLSEAMRAVFAKPTALCVIVGIAMEIYVDLGFKAWMPTFLLDAYQKDCPSLVRWAGLHAVSWHYLGAIAGLLTVSRLGDWMVKRRPGIRLEIGIFGFLAATPFIVWMAKADSFVSCCIAMGLFGLFRGVFDSNCMASFFDVVKPRYHAFGVGLMMCVAFLFGSFSSTILPLMENGFGRSTSLASLAVFYFLGAVVLLFARLCFLSRDWVRNG